MRFFLEVIPGQDYPNKFHLSLAECYVSTLYGFPFVLTPMQPHAIPKYIIQET